MTSSIFPYRVAVLGKVPHACIIHENSIFNLNSRQPTSRDLNYTLFTRRKQFLYLSEAGCDETAFNEGRPSADRPFCQLLACRLTLKSYFDYKGKPKGQKLHKKAYF